VGSDAGGRDPVTHWIPLRLTSRSSSLYERMVELPAFVPAMDPIPTVVRDLLERLVAADVVMFSTPEYAGGLPGALKNMLDWTVGGGELYGKLVAWLDVSNPGRGEGARAQLRTVLGYVGARIIEAACTHVVLPTDGDDPAALATADKQLGIASAAIIAAVKDDSHGRHSHR